jgi:mannose-6-phosphate isomerase-like protein (cupin superfamily)
MARQGDVIEHPVTGERITFLRTAAQTDGEYTTHELVVKPHGFLAAPHIHPRQVESFEILRGSFGFIVDGKERRVEAGERVVVRPGTPHTWWNAGITEATAIVELRPALKTEEFFESFFGLAQDGKVDPRTGLPEQPWLAMMVLRYYQDFAYLPDPPLGVQLDLFTPIAAEAERNGLRLPYPYPYARLKTPTPLAVPQGVGW